MRARHRRRVMRRIRRRVAFRVITGRRVAVMPVAMAIGCELSTERRVVVVREVRPKTIIVLDDNGGETEEVESSTPIVAPNLHVLIQLGFVLECGHFVAERDLAVRDGD